MSDAGKEFARSQVFEFTWNIAFKHTIPAGNETYYFEMEHTTREEQGKWAKYTRQLEDKALEIAKRR